MHRFYFDLRDDKGLVTDGEGLELSGVESAQVEAVRSLGDMVRDAIQRKAENPLGHEVAIEVRDGNGPVFQARFVIEAPPVKTLGLTTPQSILLRADEVIE